MSARVCSYALKDVRDALGEPLPDRINTSIPFSAVVSDGASRTIQRSIKHAQPSMRQLGTG
jgi:hypothetical protein